MSVVAAIGILAERSVGLYVQLLFFALVLGLSLVHALVQKVKKTQEQQRAEQDRLAGQRDGPQPGQGTQQQQTPPGRVSPVDEIVKVMREAAQQRVAQQQRTAPQPAAQQRRAAQQPAAQPGREARLPTIQPVPEPGQPRPATSAQRQVGSLQQRHIAPSARGQGASQEAERLRRHLQQERQRTAERVGTGRVGRLEVQTALPETTPSAGERIGIQLDAEEARRGIIYSEILGPPVALRRQAALWNM